jgi:hypothetical protein|tara:strand:- start:751 stop:1002 length:252 start_codon:yes stop_codon:yes gene_type:complete
MKRTKPTPDQMEKKIAHFRRVIKFRSYFGWVFAVVGAALFVVALQGNKMPLIMINGVIFFGYGLFMVWQTKRAQARLDRDQWG